LASYDTIIIKSAPGTGKSTLMRRMLLLDKEDGAGTDEYSYDDGEASTLVVGPLISFCESTHRSLKSVNEDEVLYSDVGELSGYDHKVVTMHSVARAGLQENRFFIGDEITSSINQTFSGIMKNKAEAREIFEWQFRQAEKALLLDADIDEAYIHLLMSMRGGRTLFLHNTYVPMRRVDKRCVTEDDFYTAYSEGLQSAENLVAVCDAKRVAKTLTKMDEGGESLQEK